MGKYEIYLGEAYWTASGKRTKAGKILNYQKRDRNGTYATAHYTNYQWDPRPYRQVWMTNRAYRFAMYNRRRWGKKYGTGSVYTVRKKTYIMTNTGSITLYPGDRVTMTSKQGYCSNYQGMWFRCNGYFRRGKGKHHETYNGYVKIVQNMTPSKYTINTL